MEQHRTLKFYNGMQQGGPIPTDYRPANNYGDMQNALQEFLSSQIYKSLLGDRANEVMLHSTSSYFNSFDHYRPTTEIPQKFETVLKSNDKQKLEGFEKIMAACDLLRDPGYNSISNLEVEKSNQLIYSNYGKAFTAEFTDFGSLVAEKHRQLSGSNSYYNTAADKLSFNIESYSKALNQMLEEHNEQQMNDIINARFIYFNNFQFDPSKIEIFPIGEPKRRSDSNLEQLREFYLEQMKANIAIMRDVAQSTEIISKFSDMPKEFMNGGWLEAFAKSKAKDPVAYAAHNNIKIEGKDAIQWAYDNNYQIKISTEEQKEHGAAWPEKTLNPLEYMKRKGLELSSSAKESAKKTYLQDKDTAEGVISLADSFAEEAIKGALTTDEVTKFYDKVLSNLEKQGYLTQEEVNKITTNPDYAKQAQETAALINAQTPGLEGKDKIYYKVARFTKAIGLSELSDYCLHKITPEKLGKIHAIETALSQKALSHSITHSPESHATRLKKVEAQVQEKDKAQSR